jgi:hypothetical protein
MVDAEHKAGYVVAALIDGPEKEFEQACADAAEARVRAYCAWVMLCGLDELSQFHGPVS